MHAGIPAAVLAAALPVSVVAQTRPGAVGSAAASSIRSERLASLEYPWGMAYLPDGRLLIAEKPGRLRIPGRQAVCADGKHSATGHRPGPNEQAGLLDVAVDPDFAQSGHIYLSHSEETPQASTQADPGDPRFGKVLPPDSRLMGGAVTRARLDGNRLNDSQVIWRQEPKQSAADTSAIASYSDATGRCSSPPANACGSTRRRA